MTVATGTARYHDQHHRRPADSHQAPSEAVALPAVLASNPVLRGRARFLAQHGSGADRKALQEAEAILEKEAFLKEAEEDRRRGLAAIEALEERRRLEGDS